jgi:hypothetical protein
MSKPSRVTISDIKAMKRRGEPVVMLTAYDYPSARLVEEAGVPLILVGDTLGMVVLGYETTLPVTMDDMLHHVKAVVRGKEIGASLAALARALSVDAPSMAQMYANLSKHEEREQRRLASGGVSETARSMMQDKVDALAVIMDECAVPGEVTARIKSLFSEDRGSVTFSTVHGAGRVMSRTQAAGRVRRRKKWMCRNRDCNRIFQAADDCPDHPDAGVKKVWVEEQLKPGVVDWPAVQARLLEQGLVLVGGGADVIARRNIFVGVRGSRFKDTGERVFLFDGDVFRLGVPASISLIGVEVTAGYRLDRGWRAVPYGGGGVGWHIFEETSPAALDDENVHDTFIGYHAIGGVEVPVWKWIAAAGEIQWTTVPDALGQDPNGVSRAFGESNLGGLTARVKIVIGR